MTGPGEESSSGVPRMPMSSASPGTASFDGNRQWVERGVAVMGGIAGDVYVMPEPVTERILPPGFREGPYPREEVERRLRGFVEPPSYQKCRHALGRHVLLLRADSGAGGGTAAMGLLRWMHGEDGITGLDPMLKPEGWSPSATRGYLLQGLSQSAADGLGDSALLTLSHRLKDNGSHLVVVVGTEVRLPSDATPWSVRHEPPPAGEVAAARLRAMAEDGHVTSAQLATALSVLNSPPFQEYMETGLLPGAAVDAAEELGETVASDRSPEETLRNLRSGDDDAADDALRKVRHSADGIGLLAAVALLEGQDRTVIEQYAALVRRSLLERGGAQAADEDRGRPDLLGASFDERLEEVGAYPLAPRFTAAYRYRYRTQPVAFRSRHRAAAVLRRMCLQYEGMAAVLWTSLGELSYHPGIDLAAGRALGRVLTYATGPGSLRQLQTFAGADTRWQRRLAAYAIGEVAQHPGYVGAAHEHLRQMSRRQDVNTRCTVAETCAGSYGVARPTASLRLLDTVLEGNAPARERTAQLHSAVSFALGVLLAERDNHAPVLGRLVSWLQAPEDASAHAYAVQAVHELCADGFPANGRSGAGRMSLAAVLGDHPGRALELTAVALEDAATHEAVAAGLTRVEEEPAQRRRADFDSFLPTLAAIAKGSRGIVRFLLARRRMSATRERVPS